MTITFTILYMKLSHLILITFWFDYIRVNEIESKALSSHVFLEFLEWL